MSSIEVGCCDDGVLNAVGVVEGLLVCRKFGRDLCYSSIKRGVEEKKYWYTFATSRSNVYKYTRDEVPVSNGGMYIPRWVHRYLRYTSKVLSTFLPGLDNMV